MGRINVLGFDVANLIAAGEVVDRPSSVVKELLENAIDSGAKSITVEIKKGGVAFIRVSDDGCGIEYNDLPVAILRHATSKIKDQADLEAIMTLGFRGEALAAIASVSKLRIMSKQDGEEMGGLLECHGGEISGHMRTGCAKGTTVIVEDLFYNVPARKKFLKKDMTEAAAITAVIEKVAMSKPDISFRYIMDGEIKYITSGDGSLINTVYALLGRDIAKKTVRVDREDNGIRVEGFISTPELVRANRNFENFYINSRYKEEYHFTCEDFIVYNFMDEYFEIKNCRNNAQFQELIDTLTLATLQSFDTTIEQCAMTDALPQLLHPYSRFEGIIRTGAMDATAVLSKETAETMLTGLFEYAVTYELRNNLFDFHLDDDRIITLENWKDKLRWYNTQYNNVFEQVVATFYTAALSRKLLTAQFMEEIAKLA